MQRSWSRWRLLLSGSCLVHGPRTCLAEWFFVSGKEYWLRDRDLPGDFGEIINLFDSHFSPAVKWDKRSLRSLGGLLEMIFGEVLVSLSMFHIAWVSSWILKGIAPCRKCFYEFCPQRGHRLPSHRLSSFSVTSKATHHLAWAYENLYHLSLKSLLLDGKYLWGRSFACQFLFLMPPPMAPASKKHSENMGSW